MAEQSINTIFSVLPRPDTYCSDLLHALAATAFPDADPAAGATTPTPALARLYFALGHVAVKLLVHLESVAASVKVARAAAEKRREEAGSRAAAGGAAGGDKGADIEMELGLAGQDEDKEAERMREMSEMEIVCR